MKTFICTLFLSCLFVTLQAQKKNILPSVNIMTLDGKSVNTSEIKTNGKLIVLSFWATWCKPCVRELSNISELYSDWVEQTGVQFIAISIDDTRSASRIAPMVNAKGWEFDVYNDSNGDFKRAMNVINVPHTFLLNANGDILYQHTSYNEGDEDQLYKKIIEFTK